MASSRCWLMRGCPQDMMEHCLFHQKNRKCPYSCKFAMCESKVQIEPLDHFEVLRYTPVEEDETKRSECLGCTKYFAFLKKQYPNK